MTTDPIKERKEYLRSLIPKTRSGDPKTDRLEKLDSLLYSRKFAMEELDYVEKEIRSSIEYFEARKRKGSSEEEDEEQLN